MKRIKLTQGKFALVDDEDYEELNQYKWCAQKAPNTFYAVRGATSRKQILMHIHLLGKHPGMEIDHRDRNGLNNQRSNLRFVTHQENARNQSKRLNCSSKHVGVSWHKRDGVWRAQIVTDGKQTHLGSFKNELDAIKARRNAEKELWK